MTQDKNTKFLFESARLYEQILLNTPNDSFSIEALIDIYKKLGDEEKLASLNNKSKSGILDTLEGRKINHKVRIQNNPMSHRTIRLKSRPAVTDAVPLNWQRKTNPIDQIQLFKQLEDLVFSLQHAMKSQVDLMISLYNVGLLNATQYSTIMYGLAEHQFSRKAKKSRMVVHMLEDNAEVNMEMVRYFLSKKSNIPYIDLYFTCPGTVYI